MGWATEQIERLQRGETLAFRPRGGSMTGRIGSGRSRTVEPVVDPSTLQVDDIVPCRVKDAEYLHLVKAIQVKAIQGHRSRIGNNRGDINGWIGPNTIHGRCVAVAP